MNLGNNSTFEIEIPETPAIAYGYVYTSAECSAKGELRFEIYGEKRVSPVPMKQEFGASLPFKPGCIRKSCTCCLWIIFFKRGEDIERKVEITIKREDQSIDLCEFL